MPYIAFVKKLRSTLPAILSYGEYMNEAARQWKDLNENGAEVSRCIKEVLTSILPYSLLTQYSAEEETRSGVCVGV